MSLVCEWDASKAKTNLRKHSVRFEEAMTVFDDPLAVIFRDEDHSSEEMREIIIGRSILGRLLLVFFTERSQGVIRIFSARPVSRRERQNYEEHLNAKK